jgi:hypothetical protein
MPETTTSLAIAPLRSIQASGDYRRAVSLRSSPANVTAGLVQIINGDVIFLGHRIAPESENPAVPEDVMDRYFEHRRRFLFSPINAVASYTAMLSLEIKANLQDLPAASLLRDELGLWQACYAQHIARVLDVIGLPPRDIQNKHVLWRKPDPGYVGRPRASLPGLRHVPVFKLLWPLWLAEAPLPVGYPRKTAACQDTWSADDPEHSLRLCVNPWHFERAFEQEIVVDGYTRQGIANEFTQHRYLNRDIRNAEYLPEQDRYIGQCPRGHTLPDAPVRRWVDTGIGSNRFICEQCKYDAGLYSHKFGRMAPKTRALHEPTIDELVEQHDAQAVLSPKPSHHAKDEDGDSDADILSMVDNAFGPAH